jgi:hypothetical protein
MFAFMAEAILKSFLAFLAQSLDGSIEVEGLLVDDDPRASDLSPNKMCKNGCRQKV